MSFASYFFFHESSAVNFQDELRSQRQRLDHIHTAGS